MTEPTEQALLAQLRRWKCINPDCGLEHSGPPDQETLCRVCPDCKGPSARTHEVLAVSGVHAAAASYVVIPKRATRGKLASMALRYDHAIFAPKQNILGVDFGGQTPGQIAAVMTTMNQLYEEAAEQGFYRPERETDYRQLLDSYLRAANEDAPIA